MKNIFLIILLTISLSYTLNKSKNEKYISSNLNSQLNDRIEKQFENKNKYMLDENVDCKIIDKEKIQFNITNNTEYCLNFSSLISDDNDLLILTDLNDVQDVITKVDVWNTNLYNNGLVIFNGTGNKSGFINIKNISKGLFEINKNITRESFYNTTIAMSKDKSEKKYFINIISKDNESDLYFFQTNRSSVPSDNREKINFYYINNISNFGDNIEFLYKIATSNVMKRERYINGDIEIFGYSYSGLDKDFDISISYKQIKGKGIIGPAVSLSVLFAGLVIVVAFFIKNTYCDMGYRKRLSVIKEED